MTDHHGLLFLTTAGVGVRRVLVDLFAVGLRRPALAGLPMLAIYSVPVAIAAPGMSFVPFAFGAAGFLWLLVTDNVDRVRLFGRRFTGDGRGRRHVGTVAARRGRPPARPWSASVLAIVLPVAVPGMQQRLLDGSARPAATAPDRPGSGAGATVDLYAMICRPPQARQAPSTWSRCTTTDPAPYYLRFGVADQITKAASATARPGGSRSPGPAARPRGAAGSGVTTHAYKATVQIRSPGHAVLPDLRPTHRSPRSSTSPGCTTRSTGWSSRDAATSAGQEVRLRLRPRSTTPRTPCGRPAPLAADDPIQRRYTAVPQIAAVVTEAGRPIIAGKQTTEYDTGTGDLRLLLGPSNGFTY